MEQEKAVHWNLFPSTSKWLCKISLKKQIYIYNLNLSTLENFHGWFGLRLSHLTVEKTVLIWLMCMSSFFLNVTWDSYVFYLTVRKILLFLVFLTFNWYNYRFWVLSMYCAGAHVSLPSTMRLTSFSPFDILILK